jgi:hypothetical protein
MEGVYVLLVYMSTHGATKTVGYRGILLFGFESFRSIDKEVCNNNVNP